MTRQLPPLHPGEVLREEFMVPLGVSAGTIARACGVPRTRIERVAKEMIGISADTALRLGRYFTIDPRFWLNLQLRYDIEIAQNQVGPDVAKIEPLRTATAA